MMERQGEILTRIWEVGGLDPGKPEPPDNTCDGPSVEPPVGRVLLGARADRASKDLCADEAIWP
jgi:hypothetical protein